MVTQLVEGLVKTLDGCRVVPQTGNRPGKFHARPGEDVKEWLREFKTYCDQNHIPEESKSGLLCSLLSRSA